MNVAAQHVTLQTVLTQLGINNDENAQNSYTLARQRLEEIAKHVIPKEDIIMSITPTDFIQEHGAAAFDFQISQQQFKVICNDYEDDLWWERCSRSLNFCSSFIRYEPCKQASKTTIGR